jgi:CheY-like chemotaxis protein
VALILVIDDSSAVRRFVGMALEAAGHTVIDAGDGQAGLALFHRQHPDLVITDMLMPIMEGIETIQEIRRSSRGTKIIAMSGSSGDAERLYLGAAQKLGADATLRKPFKPADLEQTVARLLTPDLTVVAMGSPQPGDVSTEPGSCGQDRRRYRRHEVIWSGRIEIADGTKVECSVLDLSAEGAKVITGQSLEPGTRVSFFSPRFDPVTAQIVWTDDRKAGLQFLDGIDRVLQVIGGKYGDIVFPAELAALQRKR